MFQDQNCKVTIIYIFQDQICKLIIIYLFQDQGLLININIYVNVDFSFCLVLIVGLNYELVLREKIILFLEI